MVMEIIFFRRLQKMSLMMQILKFQHFKNLFSPKHDSYVSSSSSSVFCPKAGPSLQAEKPSLQLYRRQIFHRKLRNQDCSLTKDSIGAVASRCFPHPTLSLASEQTLKDLKRSQGHQRGGKESVFG